MRLGSFQVSDQTADEDFLLAVLNSTPVVDDAPTDEFADAARARAWLAAQGGTGSAAELGGVLSARELLQAVVRGDDDVASLAPTLQGVVRTPVCTERGIEWDFEVDADRRLAVRAVMAWSGIVGRSPARLRPCANDECSLFLLDRSKAGSARWCSMATCGNRLKARRHSERSRAGHAG
jgi:predicted RNA-binding Zn ribbon-like protein